MDVGGLGVGESCLHLYFFFINNFSVLFKQKISNKCNLPLCVTQWPTIVETGHDYCLKQVYVYQMDKWFNINEYSFSYFLFVFTDENWYHSCTEKAKHKQCCKRERVTFKLHFKPVQRSMFRSHKYTLEWVEAPFKYSLTNLKKKTFKSAPQIY